MESTKPMKASSNHRTSNGQQVAGSAAQRTTHYGTSPSKTQAKFHQGPVTQYKESAHSPTKHMNGTSPGGPYAAQQMRSGGMLNGQRQLHKKSTHEEISAIYSQTQSKGQARHGASKASTSSRTPLVAGSSQPPLEGFGQHVEGMTAGCKIIGDGGTFSPSYSAAFSDPSQGAPKSYGKYDGSPEAARAQLGGVPVKDSQQASASLPKGQKIGKSEVAEEKKTASPMSSDQSPASRHVPVGIKSSGAAFVKENTGNIKDFYKISKCIGRGAYGEVRKCLHKETRALRAVKIINKKYLAAEERQRLLNEIDILKQLDHPNILKLYEFFQDQKRYFLVTELCNGGELFDKIAEEQTFSEYDAAKIITQILSAINYCHQRKIVHRDLKPENLLMNKDKNNPKITIIDFGTSGMFDPGKKMEQKYGTPYYIAPEVLNNNYDEKCDLWSIGVILYILLCGYPPFNGPNEAQIIKRVKLGKFSTDEEEWHSISQEAIDLVKRLLAYKPSDRISAAEALQHQWIQNNSNLEIDQMVAVNTLNNLRNFSGASKLKQAALAFIASHLTQDDEKRDLDVIFKAIDINGDGNLSKEEVLLGYEKHFGIEITEEQVDEMFDRIDLDGNGTIDYTEFVMATISEANLVTNERLKQAFKMFDKDNSGALSPEEIKDVLCFDSSVDPAAIDQIIAEVDENGDGEVQFDEFCNMMMKFADSVKE